MQAELKLYDPEDSDGLSVKDIQIIDEFHGAIADMSRNEGWPDRFGEIIRKFKTAGFQCGEVIQILNMIWGYEPDLKAFYAIEIEKLIRLVYEEKRITSYYQWP